MKRLSEKKIQEIKRLSEQDMSGYAISKKLGVNANTVRKYLGEWKEDTPSMDGNGDISPSLQNRIANLEQENSILWDLVYRLKYNHSELR